MGKSPHRGPRLSLPLHVAPLGEDDGEARARVARMRAATAHWQATQAGNLAPLVALLRDHETPLGQRSRELAADVIEGAAKRAANRPAEYQKALQRWEAARLFVVLTARLGLNKKPAIGRLAVFYGCGDGTIAEWLTTERARLGPDKWAEMEQKAGDFYDFLCDAFGDNERLRELLKTNG
jgi:hypothetical protein